MEQNRLDILKRAAEAFYLNTEPCTMSDAEYDQLMSEYRSTGKDISDLIDFGAIIPFKEKRIEKHPYENDLLKPLRTVGLGSDEKYVTNYKYDGGAIKALYDNGKLFAVISSPDAKKAMLRTQKFSQFFPETVDLSITALRGEVLVDAAEFGRNARNKANGLINTKDIDEINRLAYIRVYNVEFDDGFYDMQRIEDTLDSMVFTNPRTRRSEKLEFGPCAAFYSDMIKEKATGVKFQIDGLVRYSETHIEGFKLYCTESADVVIKDITYTTGKTGKVTPIAWFDPIELNDKKIQKVSLYSEKTRLEMGVEKGSKCTVGLVNVTIPKIINVY